MSSFFVFLFLAVLGVSSAQVFRFGKCPNIKVRRKFDIRKYLGTWYEQERFPAMFELGQKCVKANYGRMDDGNVKVTNSGVDIWSGEILTVTGEARIPDSKIPSKLEVRFSRWEPFANYWVVATDYKQFSLVYSCTNYWLSHIEYAWILTRKRGKISPKSRKKINKILRTYSVDTSSFSKTDQTACSKTNQSR